MYNSLSQVGANGCPRWPLSTATLYVSYSCLLHYCPSRPRCGQFFPSFCFSPKYTKYNHKQNDFKAILEKKLSLPPGSKGVVFLWRWESLQRRTLRRTRPASKRTARIAAWWGRTCTASTAYIISVHHQCTSSAYRPRSVRAPHTSCQDNTNTETTTHLAFKNITNKLWDLTLPPPLLRSQI